MCSIYCGLQWMMTNHYFVLLICFYAVPLTRYSTYEKTLLHSCEFFRFFKSLIGNVVISGISICLALQYDVIYEHNSILGVGL
jgi:hypothetical protein